MSAAVYIHTPTGDQFHYVASTSRLGLVVLCPVPDAGGDIDLGEVWLVTKAAFEVLFVKVDDLLDLARAVGMLVEPDRAPGEQPQSEFSAGPIGPGPMWTDEHLAEVFGLDEAAGGGA